jgi:hypothetical protein
MRYGKLPTTVGTSAVIVIALALSASPAAAASSVTPRDRVPACHVGRHGNRSLGAAIRYWWPRLEKAAPAKSSNAEGQPWTGAAEALYAFTGTPVSYAGKYLAQWTVQAGDAVGALGVRVGPDESQAAHAAAVRDLKQAVSHMHYWCPTSVPVTLPTLK